jgi:catechol 2,3-dioxygenase-like lactoylglutathione lyase family enzyme
MICKYIALFVPDLRAAESHYRDLFAMELLFREGRLGESWGTLPAGKDWDDADRARVTLKMVALRRGEFVLALFQGDPRPGTVLEICFGLSDEEIDELTANLPEGVSLVGEEGTLKLDDAFGYRWTLEALEVPFVSYGERLGHWLQV